MSKEDDDIKKAVAALMGSEKYGNQMLASMTIARAMVGDPQITEVMFKWATVTIADAVDISTESKVPNVESMRRLIKEGYDEDRIRKVLLARAQSAFGNHHKRLLERLYLRVRLEDTNPVE